MKRPIVLGLALLAGAAIGATAVNGPHAQNKAPGAYAVLDLRAINNRDVLKNASFPYGRLRRPYCLIGQDLRSLLAPIA
jgi:hypothetical protein